MFIEHSKLNSMPSGELTLEQQLRLRIVEEHVKNLSKEQTQKLLLQVVRQVMVKDNHIKTLQELIAVQDNIIEVL